MAINKVICITGGSRGIGAATARLAAADGYAVCIAYLKQEAAANSIVSEIKASGGSAVAIQTDVRDERSVAKLFAQLDTSLGRVTALVNNAGVLETQTRVENIDSARLQRVFAINVFGAFYCARESITRMSTKRGGIGGAIVNVSSRASQLGSPNEYVDYAASKGALDTFTIGLAKEVAAEGIRVNAVRAGIIDTEMHASGGDPDRVARMSSNIPMQRGGRADEVAKAILWLLSEDSAYTTGSFIDVAGGR